MFSKSAKKEIKPKYENANIPILILDPEWIQRFSEVHMTEKAKELESALRECFKKQARLTDTVKQLAQMKKNHLDRMLQLSGKVFETDSVSAKKEMEQLQAEVIDFNDGIENLTKELEKITLEVDRLNTELLEETISVSHEELVKSRTELASINPEIESLNIQLTQLMQDKKQNDAIYQNSYALLQSLLGKEAIADLDETYQKTKKKQGRGLHGFRNRNRHN